MPIDCSLSLLLGILAFEGNLITRQQLILALREWVQNKSVSLQDILVEQGALSDSNRCVLLALVDQHRENHGGNTTHSLSGLSSIHSLADDLRSLDEEIATTLSLVQPLESTRSFVNAPIQGTAAVVRVSGSSSASNRFQVLRPHARGGLGEVLVAKDIELNREVALKEIQQQFANDAASRARFLLEAEITGGLEHPGIVPVYGLGHYEDGRPFYAMRFIKGDSLKQAADHFHGREKSADKHTSPIHHKSSPEFASVEFRKLLGRFIDVCQAIEYAHSRGVLHRDLKPGNIMLGKYGETLVVDWGLAKTSLVQSNAGITMEAPLRSSAAGSGSTRMGTVIGTPAYMPPEQAAGRLDELGPASDVYSLGATLYYLLTGRSPFPGRQLPDVLAAVQAGKFPAPQDLQPQVPRALAAVCLKAMALNPQSRYASPQQLADDVERYLADEPVTAHVEPLLQRVRRWVRKHPRFVASAAATLVVGMTSAVVITLIVATKNYELTEANVKLKKSYAAELAARTKAEINEAAARQQSELALATIVSVVNDIEGGLRRLSGSSEIRQRLLITALEKLNSVATAYVDQSAVDRNTMIGLSQMGEVVHRFGASEELLSGDLASASDEEQRSAVLLAKTFFSRAHEIAKTMSASDPTNSLLQHDLSVSHNRLGEVSLQLGQIDNALLHYQQAERIRRALAAADPASELAQLDLSICYNRLGEVLLRLGRTEESLQYFEQYHNTSRAYVERHPDDSKTKRSLAISHYNLGDVFLLLGRIEEALQHFEQYQVLSQELVSVDPTNTQTQHDLSVAHERIGNVYLKLGRPSDALTQFEEVIRIRRRLADEEPRDIEAQRDLSIAHDCLGKAYWQLGRTDDGLRELEHCVRIRQSIADADPFDADLQVGLAEAHLSRGSQLLQLERFNETLEHCQEAQRIARAVLERDPANGPARRTNSISAERMGDAYLKLGRIEEAQTQFQAKLENDLAAAEADPKNTENQRNLSIAFNRLGDLFLSLQQNDDALHQFQQSLEICEKLATSDPSNGQLQRDLSTCLQRVGFIDLTQQRPAEALAKFQQAHEICRTQADAAPNDADAQRHLFSITFMIGMAYQTAQSYELAAAEFRAAAAIVQRMIERDQFVEFAKSAKADMEQRAHVAEVAIVALGPWDRLLKEQGEFLAALLEMRGTEFLIQKRYTDAAQAAVELSALDVANKEQLYSAARVLSRCAGTIPTADGTDPQLSPQRQAWIDGAIHALQRATAAGYNDAAQLASDPELSLLHDLPQFQALLQSLQPDKTQGSPAAP